MWEISSNPVKNNFMQGKIDVDELPASNAHRKYIINERNLFWLYHGSVIDEQHPASSIDKNVKEVLQIDDDQIKNDAEMRFYL